LHQAHSLLSLNLKPALAFPPSTTAPIAIPRVCRLIQKHLRNKPSQSSAERNCILAITTAVISHCNTLSPSNRQELAAATGHSLRAFTSRIARNTQKSAASSKSHSLASRSSPQPAQPHAKHPSPKWAAQDTTPPASATPSPSRSRLPGRTESVVIQLSETAGRAGRRDSE
jgi:hypothetical protein